MKGALSILTAVMLFATFVASGPFAFAQNQTVKQSGSVTGGHVTCWTYNGIVQDCGVSTGSNSANTFGLTANGGYPFCIQNTNTHTGPYVQLCEGISTSGAAISINSFNGASAPPFSVVINGTAYPFPSGVPYGATPIRTVSSGTSDSVATADQNGTVAWNSNSTSAKSESLFACTSLISGFTVTIKDQYGSAGTYPITISSSSNIDGQPVYIMSFNYQAVTLQCNGTTTTWIIK